MPSECIVIGDGAAETAGIWHEKQTPLASIALISIFDTNGGMIVMCFSLSFATRYTPEEAL